MNSLIRKASSEMRKLRKYDSIHGLETVTIVLDFTRPGKCAKFIPLTTLRVSKKIAQALENNK